MVESVEEFGSELDGHALRDCGIFDDREIHGFKTRPKQRSAAQATPCSDGGQQEGRWIEPFFLCLQKDRAGERRIKAWTVRIPCISVAGSVRANLRREREPAQQCSDAV